MKCLSIDPGKENLSYSLFLNGLLILPGMSRIKVGVLDNLGIIAGKHCPNVPKADFGCIEQMFHYPTGRYDSKQAEAAKTASILELQAIGGIVMGRAVGGAVHYYQPRQWKGTKSKDSTEWLVRKHLTPKELLILDSELMRYPADLWHNVYDAVGINLRHLRKERAGVGIDPWPVF